MKVHCEVEPGWMGRVMYRFVEAIKRFAPESVFFVQRAEEADLQILQVIGLGSLPFLKCKDYVVFQHCFLTSETRAWLGIWEKARLVASCYDLPSMLPGNYRFHRMPMGVDSAKWSEVTEQKRYLCMATGYDPAQEAIREMFDTCYSLGGTLVHVNRNFNWGKGYVNYDNISDEKMQELYSKSQFVSALRHTEGFELPAVEGLLCGARPVMFDLPCYRYWFNDVALFVEEKHGVALVQDLVRVLSSPKPVEENERNWARRKFDWSVIIPELWRTILGA